MLISLGQVGIPLFSMVKFVADKRSETVQRFPGAFRCHGRKAVGRMAECIKSNSSGGDPGGESTVG